jgi:protein arginine kinase activator
VKCESCGKNPATVHFTELSGNTAVEYHICSSCAQSRGLTQSGAAPASFTPGGFVAGMAESGEPEETRRSSEVCGTCGKNYAEFRDSGRLGCGDCYVFFGSLLRPLLRRIHGSTTHRGKRPRTEPTTGVAVEEVARLRDELRRALEREDFERCAELRDLIRQAERRQERA